MSYENNVKYLAEAWVEDGKEDDFKKSFLQSLIQQLQHHKTSEEGVGFDADMVDGKHYCEIESEFDAKLENLMSEFDIGNTHFSKDYTDEYYVSFEGIKLNHNEVNSYTTLPWVSSDYQEKDLYEVFISLYDYITNQLSLKVDQSAFEVVNFETIDALSEKIIKDGNISKLNADSVNGIRIWVVSQEWYDEQSDDVKNDPYSLFLIKDDDSAIPADLLDAAPDTVPLSSFYEFSIRNKTIETIDEDTGDVQETEERWVAFKHERDSTWHWLAPINDFLDNERIEEIVATILSGTNYTLNPSVIENSLKHMEIDNTTDIGLTRYNKNTYIVGYSYTDDSGETDVLKSWEGEKATTDSFSYLNLDDFVGYIKKLIKEVSDDLEVVKTNLNSNSSDITQIISRINGIEGSDGTGGKLKVINDKLNTLESRVTEVNNKLADWKWTYILGKRENDVFYNPHLKLVYIQIDMIVKHKAANRGKWINISNSAIPFIPRAQLRVISSNQTEFRITNTGIVQYKTEVANTQDINILGAALFPYK